MLIAIRFGRFQRASHAQSELAAPADSICIEATLIGRQDPIGLEILSQHDERRVGEIHGLIRMALHQIPGATQGTWCGWHEQRTTRKYKIETGQGATVSASQQMRGFRQHGFGGDDLAGPRREALDELPVTPLGAVEQGDDRRGVQQQFSGHATAIR